VLFTDLADSIDFLTKFASKVFSRSFLYMPTILITNDDGIKAPGLRALAQAISALGELWVVAPEKPQNAVGRSMTLHKPLRLKRIKKRWFAVNGTPADCVTLSLNHLLKDCRPDLVVSGINNGWNLGDDVTNSGTVSGALEGMLYGIPAIAVSLGGGEVKRYAMAGEIAADIARQVLASGLPSGTVLNVNVPACTENQLAGYQITTLSQRRYHNPVIEKVDPRGEQYFWIAGDCISWTRKAPSDHEAVLKHCISITPLHLDLTDYPTLAKLKKWKFGFRSLPQSDAGHEAVKNPKRKNRKTRRKQ
jgi:5'-nucleotidase